MRTVIVLALLFAVGSIASAQTAPCTTVAHSGDTILRMRAEACGLTPQQRAVLVHQQLVEAMSWIFASQQPFKPECVVVRRVCRGCFRHEVWFRNIRIVGVTQADADANGCCTQQLAARWAENIRRSLLEATHDC